jgi:FkbM family methyltransferase
MIFIYKIIFKIASLFPDNSIQLIDRIRNYSKRKMEYYSNKKWEKLFDGQEKIVFDLNDEIKINLYKDSVLSLFIHSGFEKDEIQFLLDTLKEGDTFLDVGSNVGLFSLYASKKVGQNGQVICFEPTPITYSRLMENIHLNHFANIEARNIGLSNEEGELKFYYSDAGFDAWNSFAPDSRLKNHIVIQSSTLDLQLENVDKNRIKLVKIDVEGWEKFVIQGGKHFFKNYAPIVMVEFTEENTANAGYSIHEIFTEMEDNGYQWYELINGKLVKETRKESYPYSNLIAIKS